MASCAGIKEIFVSVIVVVFLLLCFYFFSLCYNAVQRIDFISIVGNEAESQNQQQYISGEIPLK